MALTHRECTIEIENKCSACSLCNPCVYLYSGFCERPPSPTLSPSESGSVQFVKTPDTARGSFGVLTYDVQNESTGRCLGKMAVMFSVPYDFNLFSNLFAVGVFGEDRKCDNSLYEDMCYNAQTEFVRGKAKDGSLTYKRAPVTIRATMSDSYKPVIKVQISNN